MVGMSVAAVYGLSEASKPPPHHTTPLHPPRPQNPIFINCCVELQLRLLVAGTNTTDV